MEPRTILHASPLVLCLATVVTAGCGGGPTYVTAQPGPEQRTITVSGMARVELTPDEACVELTLASRHESMPVAHRELEAGLTALLAELRADGALRIERGTTRYAPDYQSDSLGRSRLIGHMASAQVNVRVRDFAKIPEVVGRAASRGLDRVEVVYYSTDLVARKAEVRQHALEAARDKAQTMAETLGVELGEVETITEGDSRTNARIELTNYMASAATDAAPDVPPAPGAIPLSISVGVVYRLR